MREFTIGNVIVKGITCLTVGVSAETSGMVGWAASCVPLAILIAECVVPRFVHREMN